MQGKEGKRKMAKDLEKITASQVHITYRYARIYIHKSEAKIEKIIGTDKK